MTRWYIGCDLGQVRDPSAVALVEPWQGGLVLSGLKVWRPARRDCMDVLDELLRIVRTQRHAVLPAVGIDARGEYRDVAAAALEGALSREAEVYPLLPSDSDRPARTKDDGWTFVGKRGLIDALRAAIASRRLLLAEGLVGGPALVAQLRALRLVPTRRGRGLTWSHPDQRGGSHDDLVSAAAMALFLADTLPTQGLMGLVRPAAPRGVLCG